MVLVDNATPPWPTVTDDSGNLTSGTKFDAAYDGAVKDTVDALCHSTADATKTPADIIAEMKDARGNKPSLNARMSGVVDADGNPVNVLAGSHVRNGFVYGNLLANDTFAMWSRGDAAAPDYWTLSGAGAAIARCGVGQADTQVLDGQDHFSARLTYGSAAAVLKQKAVVSTAQLKPFMRSRYMPVDANGVAITGYDTYDETLYAYLITHAFSNGTSRARAGLSFGISTDYSPYHPGNSGWATLVAGPSLFTSNHELAAELRCEASGAAYFQCASLVLSPLPLKPMYIPARVRYKTYTFPIIATPTAATGYGWFMPARPIHVLGVTAYAGTAPTGGTTLKLDLMTPIGGVFSSLFSTLPAFVASDVHAIQACDPAAANYRRRTIRGPYAAAAAVADNSVLRLDVNTRDSGTTGANILVTLHYFEYDRPLDQFRSMTDLGE